VPGALTIFQEGMFVISAKTIVVFINGAMMQPHETVPTTNTSVISENNALPGESQKFE